MGMVFNRMFVRPKSGEQADLLRADRQISGCEPGCFVIIHDSQDYPSGTTRTDFGSCKLSAKYGEAIFLFYYDGGSGELCGTILYEHSMDGKVVRALAYCPKLWKEPEPDPERMMWRRVEGAPEAWESSQFSFPEDELSECISVAIDYGSPSEEEVRKFWAGKTLQEGSYFPYNVQDRLTSGVRKHFKLWGS